MKSVSRYLKGYVHVRIMGDEPERFFNICSARNIEIWQLCKNDCYDMCVSIDDFYRLKDIARKTKTKVRIRKKCGYPFFVYRNRKRKGYLAGLMVFAAVIYIFSMFIWDIHFEGLYSYTEDVLLEYLKENDIKHGMFRGYIDCAEIEKMLRNEFFDITWVSVSLNGTRLTIHIQENYDYEIVTGSDTAMSDIIAPRDGIIVSIITRSGTPLVKEGTVVGKNDILVSGNVVVKNESGEMIKQEYGNADADILAKTVYNYNDRVLKEYEEKQYTGKQKSSYGIKLFGKNIYLFSKRAGYELYDKTVEQTQLRLADNFYLPVYLWKSYYSEYRLLGYTYTEAEAKELLNKNLNDFFTELMEKGVQIIENNVTIRDEGDSYAAEGDIVVIEQFGMPVSVEDLYPGAN